MVTSQEPAAGTVSGTVRVGAVRIRGFRGLIDTSLVLQPSMTVLIGENNAGKTSILEALATALRARPASEDDLHVPPEGPAVTRFTVDFSLLPVDGEVFADAPPCEPDSATFSPSCPGLCSARRSSEAPATRSCW